MYWLETILNFLVGVEFSFYQAYVYVVVSSSNRDRAYNNPYIFVEFLKALLI